MGESTWLSGGTKFLKCAGPVCRLGNLIEWSVLPGPPAPTVCVGSEVASGIIAVVGAPGPPSGDECEEGFAPRRGPPTLTAVASRARHCERLSRGLAACSRLERSARSFSLSACSCWLPEWQRRMEWRSRLRHWSSRSVVRSRARRKSMSIPLARSVLATACHL